EDGEGLDDPHDAPCLEDRVSTADTTIPEPVDLETSDEIASDQDSSNEASDADDNTKQPQCSDTNSDAESESDSDTSGPAVVSHYFAQPRHAGMAKRKMRDDIVLAPKQSRKATHDVENVSEGQSYSDESSAEEDSWYYSDDGTVSQAYWNFVANHGNRTMKNYLPDDDKCDKCFRFGQR
ncbi:unnamed protein product, partial [Alternaria alternata]